MTAAAAALVDEVTLPGRYDLDAEVYHADPVPARLGGSLSVSGAKRLLPPSCPALFRWERDHGRLPRRALELGQAAHALVLGVGAPIVRVDAADWRTKAAREAGVQARLDGATPLLARDVDTVHAMAAALRAHPVAAALLDPDRGRPEQSLFWTDEQAGGVWRRARLDWLPDPRAGRMLVPDYKTTVSASPSRFPRSAFDYGYHQQAAWYLDAVTALDLADESARFLFIVQEKTPPYPVVVYEPDDDALEGGRQANRRALEVYAQCVSDDRWPGYSDNVQLLSLPPWAARPYLEETP